MSNPWRYKLPLLIGFCYFFLLAGNVSFKLGFLSILAALATTLGFVGFAYLTNDLADRKKDALAHKPNGTSGLSFGSIGILIVLFLSCALLPWLYLPIDRVSLTCIIAELTLFVIYAFPPFRLKERGVLGVFADAMYAHALPAFLASWTFHLIGVQSYDNFMLFAISVFTWQLFSGIRNIVSHHLKDFENDRASGTKTFAAQVGKEKTSYLMKVLFIPLEISSVLVFLFVVQLEFQYFYVAVLGFLVFAGINFRSGTAEIQIKHFTNTFLDRFYIHWFPYIVLCVLTIHNHDYWPLILIHLFLFHPLTGKLFATFKRNAHLIQQNQCVEWLLLVRIAINTRKLLFSRIFTVFLM